MDPKHFDTWAGDYDQSIGQNPKEFPFIGYYQTLAAIREQVCPVEGLKVLDVGIGTALLSAELAKAGCIIYGVDFSERMLSKAAQKIPGAKLACVDVITDYLGPFGGEKFDRIISSYFMHHLALDQKAAFLSRAARENLTDGGKIIVGDVGFETLEAHKQAKQRWREKWDDDEDYWCADELVPALEGVGMSVQYRQISECAGIIYYER